MCVHNRQGGALAAFIPTDHQRSRHACLALPHPMLGPYHAIPPPPAFCTLARAAIKDPSSPYL
eukprot:scaffold14634_cov112-Isochrysis_galbana.AAC.3